MEVPEQKLPRVEPGHESPLVKMPRVEGEGVKDDVQPSDYPKHVRHPWGGTVIANDADHEATILKSFESLPPQEDEDDGLKFADEVTVLVGRNLTATEKAFCAEIEKAAEAQHAKFMEASEDTKDFIASNPEVPVVAIPVPLGVAVDNGKAEDGAGPVPVAEQPDPNAVDDGTSAEPPAEEVPAEQPAAEVAAE